jgi:hypothetical protein
MGTPRVSWNDLFLQPSLHECPMQTLRVNGYDMAYLEVGQGAPLVCVHGSLCDFRVWSAVLGPLTRKHRVIAVSLQARRGCRPQRDAANVNDQNPGSQCVSTVRIFLSRKIRSPEAACVPGRRRIHGDILAPAR